MTILDILLAVDAQTRNGLLYDRDGSGTIDSLEEYLRRQANEVFSTINQLG